MSIRYFTGVTRTDANAAYEALGGETVRSPASALAAKRITGTGQVKWLCTGSSVALLKYREYALELTRALGGQAGWFGLSGGTNSGSDRSAAGQTLNSSAGTFTSNTADFANWWSGMTITLGASASLVYGQGGGNVTCDTVEVGYIGGTGVFSVDTGAGPVSVDTSLTTAGVYAVYAVTVAKAARTITIARVSGSPIIVEPSSGGLAAWDSTATGQLLPGNVSQGGISLTSASANAWTNYGLFLAHYLPDVITWEMKGGQFDQTSLNTMLTTIQTNSPNADVILIGGGPDNGGTSSNATQVSQNAVTAATTATYRAAGLNVLYVDGFSPVLAWARVNALGWGGDGTHLSYKYQRYISGLLFRDLGAFLFLGGLAPLDVAALNITVSAGGKLHLGAADVNGYMQPDSASSDIILFGNRDLKLNGSNGTPKWQMALSGGHDDIIPSFTRITSTGPYIKADSTTRASFNRNAGTYADFIAATLAQGTGTAPAASGALTADLATGGLFIASLTGNITSFAFSNAGTSGQMIEVHFVQDATGSRTLSGASASIKWAGAAAPTLTTTANRRDIFRFTQISGSYYETSRAMNVG